MADPLRTDPSPAFDSLSPAERDTLIEELLLTGLEHYFAGEYERAITTWTRVLFLERGHARAKAYIDRARGAIGERLRESDELLHRGVDAFNRGDTDVARQLLTSAVERGGSQEVALAFLDRLSRLERPDRDHGRAPRLPAIRRPRVEKAGERRSRAWWLPVILLALAACGLFYLQASRERTTPLMFLFGWRGQDVAASVHAPDDPLPVPRGAEIDIDRARALLAAGHARDALRLVERIRPSDPLEAEAGRLIEEIQRTLLSEYGVASALPPPAESAGTPVREP